MLKVSVIVPTYNRVNRLKHVLAALSQQTFSPREVEVLVVSDGSSDGTHEYVRRLHMPYQLTLIEQANQGPAAARNNGIAHASGEYILFVDDDVVPAPTMLAEHMQMHEQAGKQAVVLGPMLTPANFRMSPWVRWEQAMLAKQYQSIQNGTWAPTARQFYTGNTSLARRHVLASGGFDPTFRRAEDVELAYRLSQLGLRFIFHPSAIGYHYAERSFRSWLETPYAYGRNEVIFARDKQQSWLLPAVYEEFQLRHTLIRWLIRLCLDRKSLSGGAVAWLRLIGQESDRFGIERLVEIAHSGMFNLRYYQGIADELGGRKQFFAQVY
ncbi:MAG: exopolysaccharide biosynthesis glycosyltransferase EpsD [Kouleothrix sp.]|jgi:GT2 family glycosyltransferase|nr:glycosyltransferase family 2 protein [Kouleothrix sp.]